MKRNELSASARRIGHRFAEEVGFDLLSKEIFKRDFGNYLRTFSLIQTITHSVGELTLKIGVEIPAIEKVVALAPGLERQKFPIFGGPAFQFADLASDDLHHYILKVDSSLDDERALAKLRAIWRRIAVTFFDNLSSPNDWLRTVNLFLSTGRGGGMFIPIAGRLCIAIKHAMEGKEHAEASLGTLSASDGVCRVQDYEQATKLHLLLKNEPLVVLELRSALLLEN